MKMRHLRVEFNVVPREHHPGSPRGLLIHTAVGRAAELAGMSRVSFLQSLQKYGASIFDMTKEELERDYQNA